MQTDGSEVCYRIALRGTHVSDERILRGIEFSLSTSLIDSDGLLCWCALSPDFADYQKPKAWHQDEPITMSHFRTSLAKKVLKTIRPNEFFHHTNPYPEWRVLSPTHLGELTTFVNSDEQCRVVALVSNFGGRAWWLQSGNRLRNRMILEPRVMLYGNQDSWRKFRLWPWNRPQVPKNYNGNATASWTSDSQIQFLSQFKVAVCLENSYQSHRYFTEKFVNAARAGCIPVYHATQVVRQERLHGAKWIDPADHGFDPKRTLDFALSEEPAAYRQANNLWLKQAHLQETFRQNIWQRIADLFLKKLSYLG